MSDETYNYEDECADCHCKMNMSDYFKVKDKLWISCAKPKDMLCFDCFENRLGRKLVLSDFDERRMAFTDHVLHGKTPQEYRYDRYRKWKVIRKLGTTLISEEDFLELVK
jgi:hypothetical protein